MVKKANVIILTDFVTAELSVLCFSFSFSLKKTIVMVMWHLLTTLSHLENNIFGQGNLCSRVLHYRAASWILHVAILKFSFFYD